MRIRDLVPWRPDPRRSVPVRREVDPLGTLQREMNRVFEGFFQDFGLPAFGGESQLFSEIVPSVDVSETEDAVYVTAELPGMDEKDVEVTLSNGFLTIQGEKKVEKEDKKEDFYHVERSFGSFRRSVPLPTDVNAEQVDATFKNGVLSISLPKTEPGKSAKKITVRAAN